MPGDVTQFLDFSVNTVNDTGENNATSINAIVDTQALNAANITAGDQSLRQRTEAVRSVFKDSLYLRDADRSLVIAGPGLITWPGSTTASASGIPVTSDNLYVLPMLTPGHAQTPPVPPVASAFGTIGLQAAGPIAGIVVTSLRRSYANGDQISINVISGASFSCVLDVETTFQRTIHITSTGSDTLASVITALGALTPSGPAGDTTPIVSAALAVGAIGSDLLLVPQTKQFMSGNYDGEGHTITPANLAAFFTANPSSALAEGDTLCISYAEVADTVTTGGRRQSIPENSNTAVAVGAFFNSRISPNLLVNAIPICKVVNGTLVFSTGAQLPAGATSLSLSSSSTQSKVVRNGDFGHGHTADATRYGVTDWENRSDLAVNASWALGVTAPQVSAKDLELTTTSTSGIVARIEQEQEVPVDAGTVVSVSISVKQLIAPTAGTYTLNLYWGDLNSNPTSASATQLQVLSSTDSSYRTVSANVTIPGGSAILKRVTIEAAGVAMASTGVALLIGSLQVQVPTVSLQTPFSQNARLQSRSVGAEIFEDITSFTVGQIAALLHFLKATPSGEGTLFLERKDQTYGVGSLPPALAVFGRIVSLGADLLPTIADSLKPRISAPYNGTASNYTLMWESDIVSGTGASLRIYMTYQGTLVITANASYSGSVWSKDVAAQAAFNLTVSPVGNDVQWSFRPAAASGTWSSWTIMNQMAGAEITTPANPKFAPALQLFDAGGNARTALDHLGMRGGRVSEMNEAWWDISTSSISNGTVVRQWTFTASGTCSQSRQPFGSISNLGFYGVEQVSSGGSGATAAESTLVLFSNLGSSGHPSYPNTVTALEWEVQVSTNGIGGPAGITLSHGFFSGSSSQAQFVANSTSPNWLLVTESTSGFNVVNTGVPVATSQRMRLELYGASTPGGAQVLGYINGVLVAQSLAQLPDASMFLEFVLATAGGSAAVTVDVSPINLRFNRVLADDSL